MTISNRRGALAASIAALLLLTGCAPAVDAPASTPARSAGESTTITDAWVKAAPDGMTAAFGVLGNPTGEDVTVVSARTDSAKTMELHETVANDAGAMVMREIDGGFAIPADGDLALEPGGNHLMMMGLTAPLRAGEEVSFTLTFSDDSTMSFTAPVKDYSGANEEYSGQDMDMDGDE
ncbi:copper chaperone PCu(A)C [Microbacterium sp. NPDC058342]|uniref:copper chaperone PCu(A)C n=1 Tax=Microbacterium sp. NPDC058342 TaxID=3346454 RepID=UPI00364CDC25